MIKKESKRREESKGGRKREREEEKERGSKETYIKCGLMAFVFLRWVGAGAED